MTTSSPFLAADGDEYEALMGRWSKRLAPLFIEFAGITAAESVLDVGCAKGYKRCTAVVARTDRVPIPRKLGQSRVMSHRTLRDDRTHKS